ncbi:MAG: hypothetical protein ACOCYP_01755 [Planctomycetota bacterium]
MKRDLDGIIGEFKQGLDRVGGGDFERRIGAELKFPLVAADGSAAPRAAVDALWAFLIESCGWSGETDPGTGRLVGAHLSGPRNETVASCETGYCKTEFSLAHAGDLAELGSILDRVRADVLRFAGQEGVRFLAYGIHPVTPPGRDLLMKKERAGFWDRALPSNAVIPPERGDDVHLFTVNAGSHVHVAVRPDEAVPLVNALNGLTGAQIALMGHSSVWRGEADPDHLAISEVLWDWWPRAAGRCGVPARPFADVDDYVRAITALVPIYAKRPEGPVILTDHASFLDYFSAERATGRMIDGTEVAVEPCEADLALHNSCYWYDARISRYYTVENRACDQQPVDALLAPAAMTLGLAENLAGASELVARYSWDDLRASRDAAIRDGLRARVGDCVLADLAAATLACAEAGLRARGRGEECHLAPLAARLERGENPADEARALFRAGGISGLLAARTLTPITENP